MSSRKASSIVMPVLVAIGLACLWSCGKSSGSSVASSTDARTFSAAEIEQLFADYACDSTIYDRCLDSMPDHGCVKLKVNFNKPLRSTFNDLNDVHYAAAEELGVSPIFSDVEAWNLRRPLIKIKSCPEYYVEKLSQSYPYLVPEAADLLKEIGATFNRYLAERGGGSYRLKVTSLMRSPQTVKSLRRINAAATDSSAHQFASTFDISYSRFICDSLTVNRTQEDMKNLLAEVLYDLRNDGRCYVKFEHKRGCFHITTRPQKQ